MRCYGMIGRLSVELYTKTGELEVMNRAAFRQLMEQVNQSDGETTSGFAVAPSRNSAKSAQ